MWTKPTIKQLFLGLKLLFLVLIGITTTQCQNFYVPNSTGEPTIGTQIPLFEGAFSWAELIKKDSLSDNQSAITLEQSVLNSSFDLTSLLPEDSAYYMFGSGFIVPNGLGINNPDTMYLQKNQLEVINIAAPSLSSQFINNNLGSLHYFGFTSNGTSISSAPYVYNDIISNTDLNQGRLHLEIENSLDFPVNFKVSVLSGSDTIFKSTQAMNSADTVIKDLNIAGRNLKPNNRIVISQISSVYDIKSPIPIDNSNGIAITAYYYNLNGKTGEFIPQPFSSTSEEILTIPVKNPSKLRSFSAKKLVFNHSILCSDVEGDVKMRRKVFDKTGLVFTDSIFLHSSGTQVNWPLDLSGIRLVPNNGTIKVEKEFIITDKIFVSLGSFPYASSAYNFGPNIEYTYFETTEEKELTVSETSYPQNVWPSGLTVDMNPRVSTANGTLKLIGWGTVECATQLSSITNGQSVDYSDTNTFNLGNSVADSSLFSSISWSTTSDKLGEAIYFLADEIVTTSTVTFKGLWGIHVDGINNVTTTIESPLDSKEGSFHLEAAKTINKEFNQGLLEQLYTADSLLLITEFRHNRENALNLNWSLLSNGDTLSMIDSMLIATDYFQEKVISPEQAIQPWEWDFNIGFEGEDIIIRNRDSLSFNISLKYLSHP